MRRLFARSAGPGRAVPAPDVMAGVEYLDGALPGEAASTALPEVSVLGVDPRVPARIRTARMRLALTPGVDPPNTVEELLADRDRTAVELRALTVDLRPLRDVLEARSGWNLLAQLVRAPSDRAANAAVRATVAGVAAAGAPEPTAMVEAGDLDVDVRAVTDGDSVVARCPHELGRGRLSLTPFFAASERLTRLLAETLRQPRDVACRRGLEHGLADLAAGVPLAVLLSPRGGAAVCAVPGAWSDEPASPIDAAHPGPAAHGRSEPAERFEPSRRSWS